MKLPNQRRIIPLRSLLLIVFLAGCNYSTQPPATVQPTIPENTQATAEFTPIAPPAPQATGRFTPIAPPAPQATPELLWVEPVRSPTDRLHQVIVVYIGNGEEVSVTTESGEFNVKGNFNAYANPARVEITLLPNTVHHLEVTAKVRSIDAGNGYTYGGYTLNTTKDNQGVPLTIVQGEPVLQQATSIITAANASRLEQLTSFSPDARLVTDFVFSNNRELISVGYDSNISVWSAETGKEVRQIGSTRAGALVVTINSDNSWIATGGTAADPGVLLWNTQTGEVEELRSSQSYLNSIAFNPNGTRLASGGNDDTVIIWDVDSRQPLITLRGDVPGRLQSFGHLFWIDNAILIAGGSEAIYWWDTNTGAVLKRLAKPDEAAFFVDTAVSQVGGRVAAAAQDAYVYFWDQEENQWSRWAAVSDPVLTQVRFSPDGQLLVGGTGQGQMLIWDVETRQLLAQYSNSNSSIAAIQFSPDGLHIAFGGWDGPIRLWGIP